MNQSEYPVASSDDLTGDGRAVALYIGHPLINDNGVIRFKPNALTLWLHEHISLNDMWTVYHRGDIPVEDMLRYYREIAYSVEMYLEVWNDYYVSIGVIPPPEE